MNVKYIVFHNDVNWQFLNDSAGQDVIASYISTSQQNFKTILASQDGFTFCKSFGQLDFYINNYWQPMMVYPASKGILSDGNLNQLIQISERNDFTPSNSVILLSNQLDAEQISTLPINTEFIENPDTNLTYYPISGAQTDGRPVQCPNSQPIATAKYYSSWAGIISTNGHGNPGMIVFSSPSECPYLSAFPENLTGWSAYNSTLNLHNQWHIPLNSILNNCRRCVSTRYCLVANRYIVDNGLANNYTIKPKCNNPSRPAGK